MKSYEKHYKMTSGLLAFSKDRLNRLRDGYAAAIESGEQSFHFDKKTLAYSAVRLSVGGFASGQKTNDTATDQMWAGECEKF